MRAKGIKKVQFTHLNFGSFEMVSHLARQGNFPIVKLNSHKMLKNGITSVNLSKFLCTCSNQSKHRPHTPL